jgi:hypothetical protein
MKSRALNILHGGKNKKKQISIALVLFISLGLLALVVLADAPPGPYFNGFETDTSSWFDMTNGGFGTITRQQSGYTNGGYATGVASAMGQWHARVTGDQPCIKSVATPCSGPFTRWGGYGDTFPAGGYRTQLDIYLDVFWAASNPDTRFDFSSSINNSAGGFLRDFVFNAGTNRTTDPGPAGFFINASTNATRSGALPQNTCPAPSAPPNSCRLPVHITTSGWYTFRHTFRDDSGSLAVDFEIFGPLPSNALVASWTIHPGDAMSNVGGSRYGWFVNEEIPDLAIDDSQRTGLNITLTPATATNRVGTSHTVTANITSTDPAGHPTAGAGQVIEFDVISGPNMGQTSHPTNTGTCSTPGCTTDTSGQVSWTYTSNGTPGTDTIQACFPERSAVVMRPGDEARQCRTVTKVWEVPTPGKVTGGGQIQGDPVFSTAGSLLSAPALMPSLADPAAQATFGFVVQCCAPFGNLEYQDHPMDVRIKAQSFDGLFISSPGTSCSSVPGSKHARFTGMAAVTRPTGTTIEPFTVEVDDCGEPGTADTFRIKTTTYANGPNTLIGGNIQIHK